MYKEEELKRLHAAGYGQVGFNYDAPAEPTPATQPIEIDEPFVPTVEFKELIPTNVVLPETLKQNAIIEKTAKFIASHGAQMEILIKAKQRDNPQFQFLNKDCSLNPYYSVLIGIIKSGKWPVKKPEIVEEKPHHELDEYLHPSLASTIIESAPSIPSIHYKPSADCDYTMLISKMRGEAILDEVFPPELAPGEVAPPGTEPLPPRVKEISHPPVLYNQGQVETASIPAQVHHYQQYPTYYYEHYIEPSAVQHVPVKAQPKPTMNNQLSTTLKSTGLSLMKNYNTDSDTDVSDFDDASSTDSKNRAAVVTPPEEIQLVVDKMAAYVARNGDEFADIVRAKNDPRFTFLEPDNVYHPYYKRLMQEKRGIANGTKKDKDDEKWNVPVSFSIKKLKEPDPMLPKPALPYETSSDEDLEKQSESQEDQQSEQQQNSKTLTQNTEKSVEKAEEAKPRPTAQQTYDVNNIPPVVVYKMEGQLTKDLPLIRAIEPMKIASKTFVLTNVQEVKDQPKQESAPVHTEKPPAKHTEIVKENTPVQEHRKEEITKENSPIHRIDKRKHSDRKKEYSSKSESRERRIDRSPGREKRREKESDRERKKVRYYKDELKTEIISLEDNSSELIDLTGDQSDSRGEGDVETDRVKQQERRQRAAEFLKKVGVDPSAATLPTTSLASAMVDTLESLRRKKAEHEEKQRRREKRRRHRERREEDSHRKSRRRKYRSSEDEDSDYDSSKKKKRKKDKKETSKSQKRRREEESEEASEAIPLNIDLTSTLKELRTYSPTKDLFLQNVDQNSQPSFREDSSEDDDSAEIERDKKPEKKKANRQYSEGEWSSDSDGDSRSSKDLV